MGVVKINKGFLRIFMKFWFCFKIIMVNFLGILGLGNFVIIFFYNLFVYWWMILSLGSNY